LSIPHTEGQSHEYKSDDRENISITVRTGGTIKDLAALSRTKFRLWVATRFWFDIKMAADDTDLEYSENVSFCYRSLAQIQSESRGFNALSGYVSRAPDCS